jgi:hypothetical protein
VLGRHKQAHHIKHMGAPQELCGGCKQPLVQHDRTPVPDQAAFRIDFPEWLTSLSARDRRIVDKLASGEGTGTVARMFGVSASRVSQLRKELKASWLEFTGELDGPETATGAAA